MNMNMNMNSRLQTLNEPNNYHFANLSLQSTYPTYTTNGGTFDRGLQTSVQDGRGLGPFSTTSRPNVRRSVSLTTQLASGAQAAGRHEARNGPSLTRIGDTSNLGLWDENESTTSADVISVDVLTSNGSSHRPPQRQRQQRQQQQQQELGKDDSHTTRTIPGTGRSSRPQNLPSLPNLPNLPNPAAFTPPHLARPMVLDPPNLAEWRERFFNITSPLLLSTDEYHTYFPHIDNVYSHRSTQKYKKKPFVSHYWDCRLKGRPTGQPLNREQKKKLEARNNNQPNDRDDEESGASSDEGGRGGTYRDNAANGEPERKKRKRKTRERNLCDVKIKITEYFGTNELEEMERLGIGMDGKPTTSGKGGGYDALDYEDYNSARRFGNTAAVQEDELRHGRTPPFYGVSSGTNTPQSGGRVMPFGLLEPAPQRFPVGHPGADGNRWYIIQRITPGNGDGNGKDGEGVCDHSHNHNHTQSHNSNPNLDHKHTLEESDRVKKNSVIRWFIAQDKEKKKQARRQNATEHEDEADDDDTNLNTNASPGSSSAPHSTSSAAQGTASTPPTRSKLRTKSRIPSRFHASGVAEQTALAHSSPATSELIFFNNSFCPFGQRTWIALELVGLPYQYVELTESDFANGKCIHPQILEVNPEGNIPCLRHGNFCIWESSVMLEYIEDLAMGHSLFASPPHSYAVGNPQLKAHSRLWTDHINRKILPAFYSLLLLPGPSESETSREADASPSRDAPLGPRDVLMSTLRSGIVALVNASHQTGPFFLGEGISYVDVAFAPWIIRLSRVLEYYRGFPNPEAVGNRWKQWVDAIEAHPAVKRTVSTEEAYHSVYGGVGESYRVYDRRRGHARSQDSDRNTKEEAEAEMGRPPTTGGTRGYPVNGDVYNPDNRDQDVGAHTAVTAPAPIPALPALPALPAGGGGGGGLGEGGDVCLMMKRLRNGEVDGFAELKFAQNVMWQEGFGLGGDIWGRI